MSSPEPRGSDERRRRGAVRLAVALLLAVFALLCAHGLRWDTPTVDEFAHLPAGYYYLRTGNFALYNQNPPLVRLLSALPLLALDPPPAVDTGARLRNTGWYPWIFGTDFMQRNRGRYELIFLLGRLPIVALGLLAGWLVFVWARDLYGDEAGLVALVCFVFCPNIVAHAHLATVDAGHAALVLLALYLFQRYLRRPGAAALLGCGAALGLAQLTKYTAVVLYPIFVLLSLLRLLRRNCSEQEGGGVPFPPGGVGRGLRGCGGRSDRCFEQASTVV
jgi:4-amino-4-deoxy-L-arabinose transferase-like glycosyltransferase